MTEKEFLYAARCNGGKKAEEQAKAYIEANPKDDYDTEDWMKATNEVRGFKILNRPGWSSMYGGGKQPGIPRNADLIKIRLLGVCYGNY